MEICNGDIRVQAPYWHVPKGLDATELTYCATCAKNGCFDVTQTRKEIIGASYTYKGTICDCSKKDVHPSQKIPFCVGGRNINYGSWFVPKENAVSELTEEGFVYEKNYCQWCVENGCVSKNDVIRIYGPFRRINCSCEKEHCRVSCVECPPCQTKNLGKANNRMIGKCRLCGGYAFTARHQYCAACSCGNRVCSVCLTSIRTGDKYIDEVTTLTQTLINECQLQIDTYDKLLESLLTSTRGKRMNDGCSRCAKKARRNKDADKNVEKDHSVDSTENTATVSRIEDYTSIINNYRERIRRLENNLADNIEKCRGKTSDQMLQLLVESSDV